MHRHVSMPATEVLATEKIPPQANLEIGNPTRSSISGHAATADSITTTFMQSVLQPAALESTRIRESDSVRTQQPRKHYLRCEMDSRFNGSGMFC